MNSYNFLSVFRAAANKEQGYIEALCLSGVSNVDEPVLNVLVIWTDYAKTTTSREFIKLFPTTKVEEPIEVHENLEESTASDVGTEVDTNE